ncbi:MAG: ADP-ribosylglycohydrolase family protein [Kiritimatiellae bacterium]|nr:ADP-ribosylglycohydrolase family protein [Kiritimatiellia bacterium]
MRAKLAYKAYRERVLAGWQGKCLGGAVGASHENLKTLLNVPLEHLWPEKVPPNDDLDLQVLWLEALQERGLSLTHDDLAAVWRDRCGYNFCEYGVFLHNVQRGIAPPLSGTWNNGFFRESEGCPIRAEIWGFVAPGNPRLAAQMAAMDGELDHGGVSVELEQFYAAAAAVAVSGAGLEEALAAGSSVVPADSAAVAAIAWVRDLCRREPDYRRVWRLLIRRYGDRDASKAMTNHALTLMALFLGRGDFKQTMLVCANSGWDADCTAATAGALLGASGGSAALPADWLARMGDRLVCGIKVRHQQASLSDLADETCLIGVEMALTRNSAIRLMGAPQVVVRSPPADGLRLEVKYDGAPVLWSRDVTHCVVAVVNPTSAALPGRVEVECPPGVSVEPRSSTLTVAAGERREVSFALKRDQAGDWLADVNRFEVVWHPKSAPMIRRDFGLGGARQWLVYGPYWDMWDRSREAECPYCNPERTCPPFAVGRAGDHYNQYVQLGHPYLDEARLLREDLPDEQPFALERGEDLIRAGDLGGFNGQACYYLTRTIRHMGPPVKSRVFVGRSGPCQIWLDGVLVGRMEGMRQWAAHEDEGGLHAELNGQPQRLVLKCCRLTDDFALQVWFTGAGDPDGRRGISYIYDTLADRTTLAGQGGGLRPPEQPRGVAMRKMTP